MKKFRKLGIAVMAALMVGIMAFGLTACGGGEEAKPVNLTASYSSDSWFSFMSAYPHYTYKQATFCVQNLETFDDGTYVLTVTETYFSGSLSFPDEGTPSATSRGNLIAKYYGTFTSAEEDGMASITLAKPTRVTRNSRSTQAAGLFFDTANWTEGMGVAAGSEDEPKTAEAYLAQFAFDETIILANIETCDFEHVTLVVTPA